MMKFLNKYRSTIILILVLLTLSFWFIPKQQKLYLQADFELLKNQSHTLLIWILIIGSLSILFFALKGVKNIGQIGNVLIGIIALAIPFYFIFETFLLSAFLLLNKIDVGNKVDKKYLSSFFVGADTQNQMIYDFRTKKILFFDNVGGTEKLQNLKSGDTVIISFSRGLLGFNLDPEIK